MLYFCNVKTKYIRIRMKHFYIYLALTLLFVGCKTKPQAEATIVPDEPIPIAYSVSDSTKVVFSPGNLQYHATNNIWRFAPNQTDYVGLSTNDTTSLMEGWIDLFGWSSSVKSVKFGVSQSTKYAKYKGRFVDWGKNVIGDDTTRIWRTLTADEWQYLLVGRDTCSALVGVAQVNGVNGLVILPDEWRCPDSVTFISGFETLYKPELYAKHQTFTPEQWALLETNGAVFLPAAGRRTGKDIDELQQLGHYWSATSEYDCFGSYMRFGTRRAGMYSGDRFRGQSVRLVKDI